MIEWVNRSLMDEQKRFLLSFKKGEPDWDALGIPASRELPAVQWKLSNIRAMSTQKRDAALQKLEQVLSGRNQ